MSAPIERRCEAALQDYLDGLLPASDDAPTENASADDTPIDDEPFADAANAAGAYWLVSAGGVALALPAVDVTPLESGAAESADAVVDVALIVTGRPSPSDEARQHLRLRAHPAHVLRVAAVTRLIDVHPDRIRWRTSAQPRPWLEGIMQSPAAAVLSVAELVKEAQRGE